MGVNRGPPIECIHQFLPQWPLPLAISGVGGYVEAAGEGISKVKKVPTKVVDKIRHWEYIDLGSLRK